MGQKNKLVKTNLYTMQDLSYLYFVLKNQIHKLSSILIVPTLQIENVAAPFIEGGYNSSIMMLGLDYSCYKRLSTPYIFINKFLFIKRRKCV
jgi:hypothetical protein